MGNIEKLMNHILSNGFTLEDVLMTEIRFGRVVEFTFRDLANDFNKCADKLQKDLLSEFNINCFDFCAREKFTGKKKIKNNFKTMYLKIVAEGIGGTKWRV